MRTLFKGGSLASGKGIRRADLLVEGRDPASTPVRIMTAESAFINTETCAAVGMDLEQIKAAFSTLGITVVETTTQQSFS